jgi:hypothetical protein
MSTWPSQFRTLSHLRFEKFGINVGGIARGSLSSKTHVVSFAQPNCSGLLKTCRCPRQPPDLAVTPVTRMVRVRAWHRSQRWFRQGCAALSLLAGRPSEAGATPRTSRAASVTSCHEQIAKTTFVSNTALGATGESLGWFDFRPSRLVPSNPRSSCRMKNKPSEVQTKESILRCHLLPAFGRLRLDRIRYATIEMTMRYAHLSPDVPRHAVKLIDGLGSSVAPAPNAGRQVGDKGRFGT